VDGKNGNEMSVLVLDLIALGGLDLVTLYLIADSRKWVRVNGCVRREELRERS